MVHPKYSGKWTKNDSGSDQTSGWDQEGMNRYGEILALVKSARENKAHCLRFEKAYLDKKRAELGITEKTYSAEMVNKKMNKGSNEDPNAAWLPEIPDEFIDEDEEDEEEYGQEQGESADDEGDYEGDY